MSEAVDAGNPHFIWLYIFLVDLKQREDQEKPSSIGATTTSRSSTQSNGELMEEQKEGEESPYQSSGSSGTTRRPAACSWGRRARRRRRTVLLRWGETEEGTPSWCRRPAETSRRTWDPCGWRRRCPSPTSPLSDNSRAATEGPSASPLIAIGGGGLKAEGSTRFTRDQRSHCRLED